MASTLRTPPLTHIALIQTRPKPNPKPATQIRCGASPRSNRGPLVKGRILSTEAILAIQSLKRAHKNPNPITNPHVSLSRLLKSDLLATLRELLRQDEYTLAIQVFSTVRSEPWYTTDFTLYADLVLALSRNAMWEDIDRLIEGLEMEGGDVKLEDKKGLGRLVRALINSDRRESIIRVYQVMKRVGWGVFGSGVEIDEYLAKVLSKGFVRLGESELAREVDLALETYLNDCLGRI